MATSITIAAVLTLIMGSIIFYNSWESIYQDYDEIEINDHWYGRFYVNPKDKRIFLPKKHGGGYTLNFANPLGFILGIGILLVIGWAVSFMIQ